MKKTGAEAAAGAVRVAASFVYVVAFFTMRASFVSGAVTGEADSVFAAVCAVRCALCNVQCAMCLSRAAVLRLRVRHPVGRANSLCRHALAATGRPFPCLAVPRQLPHTYKREQLAYDPAFLPPATLAHTTPAPSQPPSSRRRCETRHPHPHPHTPSTRRPASFLLCLFTKALSPWPASSSRSSTPSLA